jgi:N-acetylmuramoyl-L-alanine amidase
MYKWLSGLFLLFFSLLLLGSGYYSYPHGKKQWVIVIDPGHGGKDPGCSGKLWKEKNVALAVSLKLGHYIEDNDKDVKVVYTRKTDEFVGLNERAELANKDHADLFICIHCNASPNHDAYGAATYVMGLKKSEGNLEVEKRENSSILYEKDYKTTYSGFDPNSPEANILFAMYQNIFLNQSLDFASKIQSEYEHIKRKDNLVKQAGFLVLWKTAMPSLLTEIGFLTNPEEEKFLGSQKGQDEIAKALFLAFQQYKAEKDGSDYDPKSFDFKPLIVQDPDSATVADTLKNQKHDTTSINKKIPELKDTTSVKKDSVKKSNPKHNHKAPKDSTEKKINNMKDAVKGIDTTAIHKHRIDSITLQKKRSDSAFNAYKKHRNDSLTAVKKSADSIASIIKKHKTDSITAHKKTVDSIANAGRKHKADSIAVHKRISDSIASVKRKRKTDSLAVVKRIADSIAHLKKPIVAEDTSKVIYKVQFLLADHELPITDTRFNGIDDVSFYVDNKAYKYTSGHFENFQDAVDLQKKLQAKGLKDAFVVALKGGKRVTAKKPANK